MRKLFKSDTENVHSNAGSVDVHTFVTGLDFFRSEAAGVFSDYAFAEVCVNNHSNISFQKIINKEEGEYGKF